MAQDKYKFVQSRYELLASIIENPQTVYSDLKDENYYWFNKVYFKNKTCEDNRQIKQIDAEKLKKFHINNLMDRFNSLEKSKIRDIPINYMKFKKYFILEDKTNINYINENYLKSLVNSSIPYTVGLFAKIELVAPYFSRDDEEYYIIQNPVLKDKATKLPMARGSAIKGKLAKCAVNVIYEKIKSNENNLISELKKYLRIFGSGDDEIRTLKKSLENLFKKENEKSESLPESVKEEITKQFIKFLLFNLGGKVTKQAVDNIREAKDVISAVVDWIERNLKGKDDLKIQKGRLVFYPVYFNKVGIEVINRHSRKTRAGENLIFFEVVPEGEEANLALIYTPFDAVFDKSKDELKREAEEDLELITKFLEKLQDEGIGAKKKYGWGRFKFEEKMIIKRDNDTLKEYEGWKVMQSKKGSGEGKNELLKG